MENNLKIKLRNESVLENAFKNNSKEEVLQATRILCEIYFNIAAEIIGEDEVRRIRDEQLNKLNEINRR